MAASLEWIENLLDTAGIDWVEGLIPAGGRPRQLTARTLLIGICLCLADGRPAHLTRVHAALVGLCSQDKWRLGVICKWRHGPHLLTYRQIERTFALVEKVLGRKEPDGTPSAELRRFADAVLEASLPGALKSASTSYAVDWSDFDTFSCPPAEMGGPGADTEASWGRRKSNQPGVKDEKFFGYEMQALTMIGDERGPAVPELVRRMLLTTCKLDPVPALVPVIVDMAKSGVAVTDVCADTGYAYRVGEKWSLHLRAIGIGLVTDLHPNDRGPKGTFAGAIVCNGNLYCPATPRPLLDLGPIGRGASAESYAAHDLQTEELARYKLGRIMSDDGDGFHRVMCPGVMEKIRCPLRPGSMSLANNRPEVASPPKDAPACCVRQTVTVPPYVHEKTAQKHDYPSKAHRVSYARRTAVERTFSTVKDPASNDVSRGWCRLMGLCPSMIMLTCLFAVRNERILLAFDERQAEDARRAEKGLPPKTRKKKRKTIADLVATTATGPPG